MRTRMFAAIAAIALVGVSCGSDDDADTSAGDVAATESAATESAATDTAAVETAASAVEGSDPGSSGTASAAPVAVATGELGDLLVDAGGFVLYGFTPDEGGVPTCEDACADAWPPVVTDSPELPAGLDPAVYSVAERSDGTFQLVAGEWPLYRFAGDVSAGDTTGQGSGGVWFVVAPDGTLIM